VPLCGNETLAINPSVPNTWKFITYVGSTTTKRFTDDVSITTSIAHCHFKEFLLCYGSAGSQVCGMQIGPSNKGQVQIIDPSTVDVVLDVSNAYSFLTPSIKITSFSGSTFIINAELIVCGDEMINQPASEQVLELILVPGGVKQQINYL
jgi:hypothetical protein